MSRETWSLIIQSKGFYINNFRWAGSALVFSVALSIILGLAINHVYFTQGEHDFYATDGITPPKELMAMDEPNNTPYPLLANDESVDDTTKDLPQ